MSGASGKNKSTVSPCYLFSPPHRAHILITSNRLLFGCSRPQRKKEKDNNDGHWMLSSENLAPSWTWQPSHTPLCSPATVELRIPTRRHREPAPYMCMKKVLEQQRLHNQNVTARSTFQMLDMLMREGACSPDHIDTERKTILYFPARINKHRHAE